MTEDELMDESLEWVVFLNRVGLDPTGSIAQQLAGVRGLITKLREHESRLERDARSGDFILTVNGEDVRAVVGPDGAVLVVHEGALNDQT